jgi:hypothetical protein
MAELKWLCAEVETIVPSAVLSHHLQLRTHTALLHTDILRVSGESFSTFLITGPSDTHRVPRGPQGGWFTWSVSPDTSVSRLKTDTVQSTTETPVMCCQSSEVKPCRENLNRARGVLVSLWKSQLLGPLKGCQMPQAWTPLWWLLFWRSPATLDL